MLKHEEKVFLTGIGIGLLMGILLGLILLVENLAI